MSHFDPGGNVEGIVQLYGPGHNPIPQQGIRQCDSIDDHIANERGIFYDKPEAQQVQGKSVGDRTQLGNGDHLRCAELLV